MLFNIIKTRDFFPKLKEMKLKNPIYHKFNNLIFQISYKWTLYADTVTCLLHKQLISLKSEKFLGINCLHLDDLHLFVSCYVCYRFLYFESRHTHDLSSNIQQHVYICGIYGETFLMRNNKVFTGIYMSLGITPRLLLVILSVCFMAIIILSVTDFMPLVRFFLDIV